LRKSGSKRYFLGVRLDIRHLFAYTSGMISGAQHAAANPAGDNEWAAAAQAARADARDNADAYDRADKRADSSPRAAAASERVRRLHVVAGVGNAADLNRRLRELSLRTSRCRVIEGWLARDLLARREWRALGFVRLGDYTRERLGIGARCLEEEVRVARALRDLPRITSAFIESALSWTAVRLLVGVATARDEEQWIEKAKGLDTRALLALLRGAPQAKPTAPSDLIEDEDDPQLRWSVRISRTGRRLWRAACELAEREAGSTLPPGRVLELVAAEAASGASALQEFQSRVDPSCLALLERLRIMASTNDVLGDTADAADDGRGEADKDASTENAVLGDTDAAETARAGDTGRAGETRNGKLTELMAAEAARGDGAAARPLSFLSLELARDLERRDPQLAEFYADIIAEHRSKEEAARVGNIEAAAALADDDARAGETALAGDTARPGETRGGRLTALMAAEAARGDDNATARALPFLPLELARDLEKRDPQLADLYADIIAEHRSKSAGGESDRDSPRRESERESERERKRDETGPNTTEPGWFEGLLADIGQAEGFVWLARREPAAPGDHVAHLQATFDAMEDAEPHTVDARLRQVRRALQRLDFEMAGLLRAAIDRGLHRELGFTNFEDYVQASLAICPRTAWSLLAIERATRRSCRLLGEAWRDGRISSLAARILVPVVSQSHGAAWIARAQMVTLRRLEAEVSWALDRRDAEGSAEYPAPPALDLDLTSAALAAATIGELQMRAQSPEPDAATEAYVARVQVEFLAPESVVQLAEETLFMLRSGSEQRGRTFERMIALAMLQWLATPAHRDPVFARDGWRCAVPACRSRANLHDHHVVFRSHGGDNGRDNRVAVCAAHHLHGLHRGRIRAHGTAPHNITWEIGCRLRGQQPLARLLGDRYLET